MANLRQTPSSAGKKTQTKMDTQKEQTFTAPALDAEQLLSAQVSSTGIVKPTANNWKSIWVSA